MSPQSNPQPHPDEIKRELEATFTARRELGPGYDEQFIQRLVEQLTAQVRQEVARAPKRNGIPSDQRTAIAICSLVFLIPLIAIASGIGGWAVLLICLMVLGVNVIAWQ